MSTSGFQESYSDYKYLRERGYPEKAALKLVADHHRLTRVARNCLFRGVVDDATAARRRAKIAGPAEVAGSRLGVDWYNVLITVESYLRGSLLFISDDGMLRDCTAAHGSYRKGTMTERVISEILAALRLLKPARVEVFLDSPIAFSGEMAEELRRRLDPYPELRAQVDLHASADYPLKGFGGLVASSDSVILDSGPRVFDLSRHVLESSFSYHPLHLRELGGPEGRAR